MPMHNLEAGVADLVWLIAYYNVLQHGAEVAPRGKKIKELLHYAIAVDMKYPVVTNQVRKINFRFMAAEAHWILSGRNDVAYLSQFNPNMTQFSDDGVTLAGAYGKMIIPQLYYVVNKLLEDRDTRQATMTIWKPCPAPSKDIPCTVALDFKIRDGKLFMQVFMRSSDIWLGVPYDVFSFSMTAHFIAALYNQRRGTRDAIEPGNLLLTAASSHLYEPHWATPDGLFYAPNPNPTPEFWLYDPDHFIKYLDTLAHTTKGSYLRWWETKPVAEDAIG